MATVVLGLLVMSVQADAQAFGSHDDAHSTIILNAQLADGTGRDPE